MERNPNHPVTAAARDQWHKIVALLLVKYDLGHVVITMDDLRKLPLSGANVVLHERRDGLHVYIVDEAEGERLAREAGGLPI